MSLLGITDTCDGYEFNNIAYEIDDMFEEFTDTETCTSGYDSRDYFGGYIPTVRVYPNDRYYIVTGEHMRTGKITTLAESSNYTMACSEGYRMRHYMLDISIRIVDRYEGITISNRPLSEV